MKNNSNYIFTLLLGFLVALSTKSAADTPTSGLYIAPGVGYMLFANKNDLEDSLALSLGFGYQFDNPLALELVYLGASAESKLASNDDVDYQHLRLDALYYLPGGTSWNPFVVISAGEGAYEIDVSGNEQSKQTEANLGIGILGFVSKHIAVRADIRTLFGMEDELGHALFNFGLSYYFGSRDLEIPEEPDLDNDGVPDRVDQCKTTPTGVKVDLKGCALDSDEDGVANYKDKCPDTAKGIKVDAFGCPLDSDGDGVSDDKDECPQTPAGAKVDAKGCRVQLKETVEISMQLGFRSGSSEILPVHYQELAKVGNFMKQYPDTKVVIEGHTDSQGAAIFNEQLSLRRADSVRLYLINAYNLNPGRISAKGYGEYQPVADNNTQQGRSQNRRVVAVIKASVIKAVEKEQRGLY